MPLEKDTMIERCGQKSVPQIFINSQHIGGIDALKALDNRGDLSKLAKWNKYNIITKTSINYKDIK